VLVVTRKLDEGILISDNIEITVLEINKERVKIGISAPKDISIIRKELVDTLSANCEASKIIPKTALEAFLKMKK
jgi:carbon storage regulator